MTSRQDREPGPHRQAVRSAGVILGSLALIASLAGSLLWLHGRLDPRDPVLPADLAIAGVIVIALLGPTLALVRAIQQRNQARALLQLTLDTMEEGLMLLGPHQRPDLYNKRAIDLLDLPADLIARRALPHEILADQMARGEFAKASPESLDALLRTPPASAASYEWTRPNGRVLETRSTLLPDGRTIRTFTDVTDRRRALDDMNASIAFANSLVNASPDCIQLLDLNGNISFISDLGQELFEIKDFETVRGMPFSSLFAEEHRGRVELALRRVRDGQTDRFTRKCPTLGGIARWWDFIITPVHQIGRTPERLFVVARDVSAREAQAEELGRAKEAAERASLAKTQFLASMSHEIRTPLYAILGFAALAREHQGSNPKARRQIELIQKAGEALLTITNDVLDLSKIEAGKVELEERSLRVRGLFDDCLSMTSGLAEQKGLTLGCTISPAIPGCIVADEARLRQVLLNLLNNAIKFTPSGSVRMTAVPIENGTRMKVSISDTGIGISAERISQLFHDFVQGDGSISRQYGGTGLGLSISRRLIRLMGGEIGVDSVVGQGSTFHLALPLVEAAPELSAGDAPGDAAQAAVTPRSILLVDDLSINLEIVGEMLASAGHRVSFASSGPMAIAAYREGRHDLILMDVQMPDMDGLETTRRIRELGGDAVTVPVVALTANVFSQQIASYRDAGMNDHLGKPFHRGGLLAMVERLSAPDHSSAAPQGGDDTAPAILDQASQRALTEMIGVEKTSELLRRFRGDLPQKLGSDCPVALKADAHAIISTSGLLGFSRLSLAARALEQSIDAGGEIGPALAALLAARAATLACIASLPGMAEATESSPGKASPEEVA